MDSLPSNELNNSRKLNNLLELSEKEKADLREKIQKSNGFIEIWVHTHNSEDDLDGEVYKEKRDLAITSLSRLNNHLPVIAFIEKGPNEENSDLENKYKDIYNTQESSQPIFYVPTLLNDPTPNTKYFESNEYKAIEKLENKTTNKLDQEDVNAINFLFGDDDSVLNLAQENYSLEFLPYLKRQTHNKISKEIESNWQDISNLFSELGVKTIIVRGRNYIERKQLKGLSDLDEKFLSFTKSKDLELTALP